jgi:8-hydroxy-5-deazaflavin:NADPH oxidoreductase
LKIAFIGAGNMATGLGKHWAKKGHELFFSHSRDQEKLKKQAASVSASAMIGTAEEAVRFADVILLTTPYGAAPEAIKAAGDLTGKVLWSIVNPMKPDFTGLEVGTTSSGAEELAKLAPNARFVSALPPFAETLQTDAIGTPSPSVFVCSDDVEARAIVVALVTEFGADAIDAGPLYAARFFEPMMMGLVYLAYSRNYGGGIGLQLLGNTLADPR